MWDRVWNFISPPKSSQENIFITKKQSTDYLAQIPYKSNHFKAFIYTICNENEIKKIKFLKLLNIFLKDNIETINFELLEKNIRLIIKNDSIEFFNQAIYFAFLTGDIDIIKKVALRTKLEQTNIVSFINIREAIYYCFSKIGIELTEVFTLEFADSVAFEVNLLKLAEQYGNPKKTIEVKDNVESGENSNDEILDEGKKDKGKELVDDDGNLLLRPSQSVITETIVEPPIPKIIIPPPPFEAKPELQTQEREFSEQLKEAKKTKINFEIVEPDYHNEPVAFKVEILEERQKIVPIFTIRDDDEEDAEVLTMPLGQTTNAIKYTIKHFEIVDNPITPLDTSSIRNFEVQIAPPTPPENNFQDFLKANEDKNKLTIQIRQEIKQFSKQKSMERGLEDQIFIRKLYDVEYKIIKHDHKWSLWQWPWQNRTRTKTANKILKIINEPQNKNITNDKAKQILKKIDKKLTKKLNHYSFFRTQSTIDKYRALQADIAMAKIH